MIDPVLAYYHLRILHEYYYECDDIESNIIYSLMKEITTYYDNMFFSNFTIIKVYGDGDCLITTPHNNRQIWIKLKDILEYKC